LGGIFKKYAAPMDGVGTRFLELSPYCVDNHILVNRIRAMNEEAEEMGNK
jgi:hypothetical protein